MFVWCRAHRIQRKCQNWTEWLSIRIENSVVRIQVGRLNYEETKRLVNTIHENKKSGAAK